jgi:hypothetical protein
MYQSAMDALLGMIRSGSAGQGETVPGATLGGQRLLRATGLAVMGQMAAAGRPIAWKGLVSPSATA